MKLQVALSKWVEVKWRQPDIFREIIPDSLCYKLTIMNPVGWEQVVGKKEKRKKTEEIKCDQMRGEKIPINWWEWNRHQSQRKHRLVCATAQLPRLDETVTVSSVPRSGSLKTHLY